MFENFVMRHSFAQRCLSSSLLYYSTTNTNGCLTSSQVFLKEPHPNHLSLSVVGLAAPVFTFAALGNKAIGQIKLFEQTWPIQEEYIHENHSWKSRKISGLWEDPTRMLIYYVSVQGKMNVVSAVLLDQQLKVGDRLIIGTQPRIRPQRKSFIRKLIKAFANIREFQKHAQSVVGMAIALLVIILLSTFTYVASKHNLSFVDALYFAVGMITGAGGNDKFVENAPDSIKLLPHLIFNRLVTR